MFNFSSTSSPLEGNVHAVGVKETMTDLNTCSVRYYTRAGAENAMRFINGTRLDDRIIRTDWDAGFKEGRQYGRGKSGGQVRFAPLFSLLLLASSPLRGFVVFYM